MTSPTPDRNKTLIQSAWWAYLNQPLFDEQNPVILNPVTFARLHRTQLLEECWNNDFVALIERCWDRNGRPNENHHGGGSSL